jgi:hypothetical protein
MELYQMKKIVKENNAEYFNLCNGKSHSGSQAMA